MYDGLIVFLGTVDLDGTDRFYRDVLGLILYRDQGVCRIYDVPGGGRLGFCSHMEVTVKGNSPIVTLLVEDVDGVYRRLLDKGVAVMELPVENEKFGIYHFFLRDPNGYLVEVQRFLD